MHIKLDAQTVENIKAHIASGEDSEELDTNDYAVSLDEDCEAEIALAKDGIDVLCVVKLGYDEALDGWYVKAQIEDNAEKLHLLSTWPPLTGISLSL